MAKSKLKQMAEAGNPWAIETLARMRAQGRAAGLRGAAMQRRKRKVIEPVIDAAFAQALRDAEDIRKWTDGPRPAPWRIYRLAKALVDG